MFKISVEIPENFDIDQLAQKASEMGIVLEETPGTWPRIINASAEEPLCFYNFGSLMAIEKIMHENV